MLSRLGSVIGGLGFLLGFPILLFAVYVAVSQSNHERWLGVTVLTVIGGGFWMGGRAVRYILGG